ncbi:MAG: hypothetical protein J2O49_04315, partial [Sciscionella sp.]|nr:hypothetical protein [Sciscionella sp.]
MSVDEPTGPIQIHESWLPKDHALHRPRHGRRQHTALVCAVLFFLTPALAFVFGVRPQEIENHRLASFPSLADGFGFFTGLSNWATDHLPLRDAGVHAEAAISNGVFGEPPAYSQIDRGGASGPVGGVGPPTPQAPDQSSQAGTNGFPQVIQGKDGWLYYGYDMQAKCQPVHPLSTTISALQRLRTAVTRSGRRLVVVIAPDKSTVLPEHLPDTYAGKQCAASASTTFWNQVPQQTGALDLRQGLRDVGTTLRQPVYLTQDTHWTDLGAMNMLYAVAEHLTPGISTTWAFHPTFVTTGAADLPKMLGTSGTNTDQSYSLAPDGGADRAGGHPVDNLDQPYRSTGEHVRGMIGGKVALLGDSFLLPALRYLPAVFDNATAYYSAAAAQHQDQLDSIVDNSDTIVLEVVERNLAAGTEELLQPGALSNLISSLA